MVVTDDPCYTGTLSDGSDVRFPVVYFSVKKISSKCPSGFLVDSRHTELLQVNCLTEKILFCTFPEFVTNMIPVNYPQLCKSKIVFRHTPIYLYEHMIRLQNILHLFYRIFNRLNNLLFFPGKQRTRTIFQQPCWNVTTVELILRAY